MLAIFRCYESNFYSECGNTCCLPVCCVDAVKVTCQSVVYLFASDCEGCFVLRSSGVRSVYKYFLKFFLLFFKFKMLVFFPLASFGPDFCSKCSIASCSKKFNPTVIYSFT